MTQSNNDFVNLATIYNADENSYVSKSSEKIFDYTDISLNASNESNKFTETELDFLKEHESALSKRVDWCRFVNSL